MPWKLIQTYTYRVWLQLFHCICVRVISSVLPQIMNFEECRSSAYLILLYIVWDHCMYLLQLNKYCQLM